MARIAARDAAFRLLFARMLGGGAAPDDIARMEREGAATQHDAAALLDEDDRRYIDSVAAGCAAAEDELDGAIERNLRDWDIDRLSRVDLCILRLAAYEMLEREDIPVSVAINEAVELARTYSTDDAPGFINGVLGAIARESERA